ncbi:DUF5721 family protein [Bilifractor porci]|uniref:Uncharacterized protein n=1 Tax=Bilifractor porci TaxID=2606636 RepID=A0A7X2TQ64_9FIRM|nr:DUF5721 family protein [Bilifractor porci]MST82511.1 hypothetical protein [Bilifractor porci]
MLAIQIDHVKDFMKKLLLQDAFDSFLVSEISITTFTTFSIDGQLHPEFFDPEKCEALRAENRSSILWKEARPFCLSIIKGQQSPLSFHIVLQADSALTAQLSASAGLSFSPEDIFGLFLNLQFRGGVLSVTTGTSLKVFTPDKSLDRAWDRFVSGWLEQEGITG